MNYKIVITRIMRSFIVLMCFAHTQTFTQEAPQSLVSQPYETHPFMMPEALELFAGRPAADSFFDLVGNLLKKESKDWLITTDSSKKINRTCGLGLVEVLKGDKEAGQAKLRAAANAGSSWAYYYLGLLQIADQDPSEKSQAAWRNFTKAVAPESNSDIDADGWHKHIMAMAGFPSNLKNNPVTLVDRQLLQKVSLSKIAYLGADFAARKGDSITQQTCLNKALSHISQTDLNSCTHEQLKKYKTTLRGIKQQGLDVSQESKNINAAERLLIKSKNNKNNSEYISALIAQAEDGDLTAQCELGVYYIENAIEKDKVNAKKGWELLAQAAKAGYPEACYRISVLKFQSEDPEAKKKVAHLIDQQCQSGEFDTINFTPAQKGEIYDHRGIYALRINDLENARIYLQKAADCGNNAHAENLAILLSKHAEQEAIKTAQLPALQARQKELQEILKTYASKKELSEKDVCLKNIVTFMRNGVNDGMREIIVRDAMFSQLDDAAKQGSAYASYILAYCAQEGWGMSNDTIDPLKAFKHYQNAIAAANNSEELKQACIEQLKILSGNNCKEAKHYLRTHYPSQEQTEIDALYARINELKWQALSDAVLACSDAQVQVLEEDLKDRNKLAAYFLGIRAFKQGVAQGEKSLMKKSFVYMGLAKAAGCSVDDLQARMYYEYATLQEDDPKEQKEYYKKAAELGSLIARRRMYLMLSEKGAPAKNGGDHKKSANYLKEAETYLKKAIDKDYLPARIDSAKKKVSEQIQAKLPIDNTICTEVSKLLEQATTLEQQEKDDRQEYEGVLASLYRLKADMLTYNGEHEQALGWIRKAIDAGACDNALLIRSAVGYLKLKKYEDALKTLEKKEHLNEATDIALLKAFASYKKENSDETRKQCMDLYLSYLSKRFKKLSADDEALYFLLAHGMLKSIQDDAEKGNKVAQHVLALYYYEDHKERDFKKAYNYAQQAGVHAHALLTNFYLKGHGVCEKDNQKAFDNCVDGVLFEKDVLRQYRGRMQLLMIMTKWLMIMEGRADEMPSDKHDGAWDDKKTFKIDLQKLEKIYLTITQETSPEAVRANEGLLQVIPASLAHSYFIQKDVKNLYAWYMKVPDLSTNLNANAWQALLHEHNMFEKKEATQASKAAVECWTKAALLDDPVAQERLVQIYSVGATFANGVQVVANVQDGVKWAQKLVDNQRASGASKLEAYRVLGMKADLELRAIITKDPRNQQKKKEAYDKLKKIFDSALKAGDVKIVMPYLEACKLMDDKTRAAELCEEYGAPGKKIWQEDQLVRMGFMYQVLTFNPIYAKQVVNTLAQETDCLVTKDNEIFEHTLLVVGLLKKLLLSVTKDNCAQYGFDTKEDADKALADLEINVRQGVEKRQGSALIYPDKSTEKIMQEDIENAINVGMSAEAIFQMDGSLQEKEEAYNAAKKCYDALIARKDQAALVPYVQLCRKAREAGIESAAKDITAMLEGELLQSVEDGDILLAFNMEMLALYPNFTKKFLDHLIERKKSGKLQIPADSKRMQSFINNVRELAYSLNEAVQSYASYGFSDEQAFRDQCARFYSAMGSYIEQTAQELTSKMVLNGSAISISNNNNEAIPLSALEGDDKIKEYESRIVKKGEYEHLGPLVRMLYEKGDMQQVKTVYKKYRDVKEVWKHNRNAITFVTAAIQGNPSEFKLLIGKYITSLKGMEIYEGNELALLLFTDGTKILEDHMNRVLKSKQYADYGFIDENDVKSSLDQFIAAKKSQLEKIAKMKAVFSVRQ